MAITDALLLLGVRLLVCGSAMEHSGGKISGWASNPNYSTTSVSGEISRTGFALGRKSVVVMGAGAILVLVCSSVIAYMCIGLSRKRKPPDEPVKKDIPEVQPTGTSPEVEPVNHIAVVSLCRFAHEFSPSSDAVLNPVENARNFDTRHHPVLEEHGYPLSRSNQQSDILLRPSVPNPIHARDFDSYQYKDGPLFRTNETSDTLFSPVTEDKDGPLFRSNENSDTLASNARNSYSYRHATSEENGEPLFRSNEKSESLLGPNVPIDARSFGSFDHHAACAASEEMDDPLFRTNGKSDTPLNTGVGESGYPIDKKQVIPIKIPQMLHTFMDKAIDSGVQKVVAIGVDKVKQGMDKVKEEMHSGARKVKEKVTGSGKNK